MAYEFAAADKASQYPGFPGSIFAMKELDFEFALKAAGAGAWEWDIKTDEARWSQKNYELMGLPPGSGKADYNQWLSCVHPDDRDDAQRKVSDAIESRGDLDFIYRAVWPDGSVKWVRDLGKMLLDADGDPIGMYGIQLDVTEQRAGGKTQKLSALRGHGTDRGCFGPRLQ